MFRIFIIFIGVGFVIKFVYGYSESGVRFYGNRIIRYGISVEVVYDFGLGFNLFDGDGSGFFKFEVEYVVECVGFDLFIFGVGVGFV